MSVTIKDYTPEGMGPLNDEQPERKPLLSDDTIIDQAERLDFNNVQIAYEHGGIWVRNFYEAKITSGELRVVNAIPRSQAKEHVLNCKENMDNAMDTYFWTYIHFCPGCGAKIIEG